MDINLKKKLIKDIIKLPVKYHEQIFEKILQYSIDKNKGIDNLPKYTSNKSYTFIDLNLLDNELIEQLTTFVLLCQDNVKYNNERDFLYQKAKENLNDKYTNDYDLDNVINRSNGIKII
jgi:hypothetical protein